MKIVIDTNVLISGVFFSGAPRKVLNAVIDFDVEAFASPEIIEEYQEIIDRMIERKHGNINRSIISQLLQRFSIITPVQAATECRDPDDNKFLDCARAVSRIYSDIRERGNTFCRFFRQKQSRQCAENAHFNMKK